MKDNLVKFNCVSDLTSAKLFAEGVLDTVHEPLIVLDSDLSVIFVNDSFYDYFKIVPSDNDNILIYELGDGQWDIPDLRKLLEDFLPKSLAIKDFKVYHHFENIGKKTLSLNARMTAIQNHDPLIIISITDISDLKLSEEYKLRLLENKQELSKELQTANKELKIKGEKLIRLNHTLRALSNSDHAMMHAEDEVAYLEEVCRIIIEDCGHAMVWIGYAEEDENKTVKPVAHYGFDDGYVENLNVTWADTERGRGPTGTAIRTGQPCGCKNMLTDPNFKPWCDEARKRGYASSIVLPLIADNKVLGAISIYSKEPDSFSDEEVKLLIELANDLAFGITNLRLKNAQAEAEEYVKRQAELIELSFDAIIVWELDGAIESWNRGAEELYGYSKSEALGHVTHELLSTFHPLPWNQIKEELLENGRWEGEIKHQTKEGRIILVSTRKQLVIRKDGSQVVMETNRDITKRKKAEEKLKNSYIKLRLTQNKLEETIHKLKTSNAELEQFAYVASHDLQEPLRMISSFAQLLEKRYKDRLDQDANDYIGFVVDAAHRMKELIDDLLAFSRLNTESMEFKAIKMSESLKEVLSNLQTLIKENDAEITSTPLPTIKGDPSQIRQLFQNLIVNAIKFNDKKSPRIHVSLQDFGNFWKLGISDNGIGIVPEHQEKIFDVFKRVHSREEYPGTGIGLAICKKIVERHGGRIWVESEPETGSTFNFTLPK